MMLETQRLLLRGFTLEDQADFNALIRDKMASPWAVYDHGFPTDDDGLREVLAFFAANEAFIAIVSKAEGRVVGLATLHPTDEECVREIGYCIHSVHQRKGYASEAVAALKEYARDVQHVQRLVCGTAQCNEPSVRLLRKMGFTVMAEGPAAFAVDENGEPVDPFEAYMFECVL